MFYSQLILAKKGPLGRIWLAAHFHKKLNKKEIFSTSIRDSVESIISPDEPLSLRVSGHLLLGVVRIFSKKCHFLAADCRDARLKLLHAFRSAKNRVDMNPEEQEGKKLDIPEFQVNYGMDDDIFEQDGDAGVSSTTGDDDHTSASDEESWKTGMFVHRNIASSDADILMHSDHGYSHIRQSEMSDMGGGGGVDDDDGFGDDGGFDESIEFGRDGQSMGGFNGGDESFGAAGGGVANNLRNQRMSLASMASGGAAGDDNFDGGFDPASPQGGSGASYLSPLSNATGANAPSPGGGMGMNGVDDSLLSAAKAAAAAHAQNAVPEDAQPLRKRAKRARPAVRFDKSTMMTKKEMDRRRDHHPELVKRRGIPDALYNALPPSIDDIDLDDEAAVIDYNNKKRQFSRAAAIVNGVARKRRKRIRFADMMRRPAAGSMHPRLMAMFASVATTGPLPFRKHSRPPLPGSPAAAEAAHLNSSALNASSASQQSAIEFGRDADGDRRMSGGLDRSGYSALGGADGGRRSTMGGGDDFGGYDADDADGGFGGGFDDFDDDGSGMQYGMARSPGEAGGLGGADLGVLSPTGGGSTEKEAPLHRQVKKMLAKLDKMKRASAASDASTGSSVSMSAESTQSLNFSRVVAPCKTSEEAAKCFMDLLTLCSKGKISLDQEEAYGNIVVSLR